MSMGGRLPHMPTTHEQQHRPSRRGLVVAGWLLSVVRAHDLVGFYRGLEHTTRQVGILDQAASRGARCPDLMMVGERASKRESGRGGEGVRGRGEGARRLGEGGRRGRLSERGRMGQGEGGRDGERERERISPRPPPPRRPPPPPPPPQRRPKPPVVGCCRCLPPDLSAWASNGAPPAWARGTLSCGPPPP